MAEPLKNHFGPEIPRRTAGMISAVFPGFHVDVFLADALNGYDDLDLTPRGRQIARALRRHLPDDYAEAAEVLIASLGPKLDKTEEQGMAPFLIPPARFVRRGIRSRPHGLSAGRGIAPGRATSK